VSDTPLASSEQQDLHDIHVELNNHKSLFVGSQGTRKTEKCNIKPRADATLYHARSFPIPKLNGAMIKFEVQQLCVLGVLKTFNCLVKSAVP
jgi:hypothetical protein